MLAKLVSPFKANTTEDYGPYDWQDHVELAAADDLIRTTPCTICYLP